MGGGAAQHGVWHERRRAELSTCGWKNGEGRTLEQGEMEVRRERRAGFDLLVDWEHGEASCDWHRGVLTLEREGGDDRWVQ